MNKLFIPLCLGLAACGGAGGETGTDNAGTDETKANTPAPGYTRFTAAPIDLAPGQEGTWCQWVAGPAEADIDIMDVKGEQLFPGHHALLLATSEAAPTGTTRPCKTEDLLQTKNLGGIGGEGSASLFPTGAAVRLKKGQSLLMNTHYLNTTSEKTTGQARLDVKFEAPSPEHVLASLFANSSLNITLMPQSDASLDLSCVVQHDVKLIDWANHMHNLGQSVYTEEIHAGGAAEDLRRDATWQYEWQFNAPRRRWTVDAPHVIKAGDTLHTRCTWKNASAETLTFPREMCVGSGFIIGDMDILCNDGQWLE